MSFSRTVSVGLVQFSSILGDKQANLKTALQAIDKIADQRAKVIVLPELWLTGYLAGRKFRELAETIPGAATRVMAERAQTLGAYLLLGSIPEKGEFDKLYNTSPVISPKGRIILKHRKVHLWRNYEKKYFLAGDEFRVADTSFAKIGLAICHDVDFPEVPRTLALKGAEILFCPSAYPSPFEKDWDVILAASAIQNHAFLVAVNHIGDEAGNLASNYFSHGVHFFGKSKVVSPSGETLLEMRSDSNNTEVALVELNLEEVRRYRNSANSFFAQRRPETYI